MYQKSWDLSRRHARVISEALIIFLNNYAKSYSFAEKIWEACR